MVSKWVGDALGKEGIYASWIALRQYPWIPSDDYRDRGQTAASIMVPLNQLITINARRVSKYEISGFILRYISPHYDLMSLTIAVSLLKESVYHGYPVVTEEKLLLGYITRTQLERILGTQASINTSLLLTVPDCTQQIYILKAHPNHLLPSSSPHPTNP